MFNTARILLSTKTLGGSFDAKYLVNEIFSTDELKMINNRRFVAAHSVHSRVPHSTLVPIRDMAESR